LVSARCRHLATPDGTIAEVGQAADGTVTLENSQTLSPGRPPATYLPVMETGLALLKHIAAAVVVVVASAAAAPPPRELRPNSPPKVVVRPEDQAAVQALWLRHEVEAPVARKAESPMAHLRPSVNGTDGVVRTHRREHERPLMTVFGPVMVSRTGYGARGSASLHPLDAQLNLPEETYSHGVRRRIAEEVARGAYEEAIASLAKNTGAEVPKRQAEQLAARAAMDFEAFYVARRAVSPTEEARSGGLVVLTSDGKGVPMRKEHLREATRVAAEKAQHKLTKRLSKGEKNHRKRWRRSPRSTPWFPP
jgi:hypothetical protein